MLVALIVVVPSASAEALSGNVTALGLLVEGPTTASSESLRLHMGKASNSFATPPFVSASGEVVRVERDFDSRTQVCTAICMFVDNQRAGGDHSSSDYAGAQLQVQSWQRSGSEILVGVGEGFPTGTGQVVDTPDRPTPLTALERTLEIRIGARDEFIDQPDQIEIPAGTLTYAARPATRVQFDGDFTLYLFGATFTVTDNAGTRHPFETGFRQASPDGSPGAHDEWHNITILTFTKGRLVIEPRGNPVDAYLYAAHVTGTGLVHFETATGILTVNDRIVKQLVNEPVHLQGEYALDVRTTRAAGLTAYSVGIAGEFEGLSFSTAALRVASTPYPYWTWPLLVGMAALGGSGVYVLARRRRKPSAKAADKEEAAKVMERAPVHAGDPPLAALTSAPLNLKEEAPGLSWDAMTEEFGLIHAGEKAGIFVLLVPEERVQTFLHAVRGRGLIAEDTGDRVQAGQHPLAVVALEPSPVAMN